MDAIITAGGVLSPDDPLYQLTGVKKKAIIPLVGRPMISWVIDAIRGSGLVEHIILVGLEPDELKHTDPHLYFVKPAGNLVDNILTGMDHLETIHPAAKKFLLFSSDIPLITPEIVRGFVAECDPQDAELYYAVVEEKTMEARFPASRRTFVPLKGGRYSGGDAFLMAMTVRNGNTALAQALTGSRKNYLEQARMIGFGFIIRFLLRRMTVHEAARHASEKAHLDGRVVDTRFAELGMDLDKIHQYEIIKTHLEKREAQTA